MSPPNDDPSRAAKEYGESPEPFQERPREATRWRFIPLVASVRGYSWTLFRVDLVAGVALAALAVPQAMAYAQTAGLPVVAGLYGLLLPLVAYSALGSSRSLMTGPTATSALLVAPALATVSSDPADYPVLAAMLALLVAAVFLLARLLRLGWISDYFSAAVLLGFLTGLALTLVSGQLDDLTGVAVEGDTALMEYVSFAASVVGGTHATTLLIGVLSLAALIVGGRFLPKFPMLLLVTVAAIGASALWDLGDRGVVLVGEIPPGLPKLAWPSVSVADIAILLPSAVGIALVGFSDAILTARSLAQPDSPSVDTNQELTALAGINVAAGVSQSFPLGSSGSRTAVNIRLGGRTQVVGLVQAVGVTVVLLLLTGALALLPKATLGAVIIYAALGLMDLGAWRGFARGSRGELLVAVITVLGMLTIGLLPALVLAVLLSVLDVVRRSAQPRDAVLGWSPTAGRFVDVVRHPDAVVVPGIVIYRLDERLFFANSRYFRGRLRDAVRGAPYPVTALVFDAESVTDLDTAGAQAFADVADELRGRGVRFVLARSRAAFVEQLSRTGHADVLAPEDQFPTVRAAVRSIAGVTLEEPDR
ncbi:MAG TPA: SulP family inorganic anion transporter [Nocardioides sp.]|uniref:SulP family inorganic anion transporter n=1 Tax=Nocardioides sp. TaxID=35761 RepID=UPI002B69433B|nr:SulP family inorganic anion transporter [Nocardioides sp.]HQR25494.1 SulP family inorganic anion transporter [Nocardioides sp.]